MPEHDTPPPERHQPARAITLRIEEESETRGTLFRFLLREPDRDPIEDEKLLGQGRGPFVQDLYRRLSAVAASSETATRTRLEGIGLDLCRCLLPDAIRDRLWCLGDVQPAVGESPPALQIVTRELDIPWQVLRLPKDSGNTKGVFLAAAFALTCSKPGGGEALHLPCSAMAVVATRSEERPREFEPEAAMLDGLGNGCLRTVRRIQARYAPVADALASTCYDAWHFAAHGSATGKDHGSWGIRLEQGDALTADDVASLRAFERLPLVFLNSCHGGRVGLSFAGDRSLAASFMRRGAGAVIGPQWKVDCGPAADFARLFYEELLDHGLALGEALHRARRKFRCASPEGSGWLAYACLGHPLASAQGHYTSLFLSFSDAQTPVADEVAQILGEAGIGVGWDRNPHGPERDWSPAAVNTLQEASYYAFVAGPEDDPARLRSEIDFALNRWARRERSRIAVLELAGTPAGRLAALGGGAERLVLPGDAGKRSETLRSWATSLGQRGERPMAPTRGACPFPGLEPFDEHNARFFFGRSEEVLALCQCLGVVRHGRRRWLQIEGASGAGKSSLARAGLVPAVRRGWIKGTSGGWSVVVFRPGNDPLRSLAAALEAALREQGLAADSGIERRLWQDPAGLRDLLRVLAGGDARNCLLVADQLEELFTLTASGSPAREQLDDLLATALDERDGPLFLVTTIRNDFIPHFVSLPKLGARLNRDAARHHLAPLTREALREVIRAPIRLAALSWEDEALPEQLVAAADEAGGSLPLLAYFLRLLWQGRDEGGKLLRAVYDRLGGLGGALAKGADDTIATFDEVSQDAAKALFLALVRARPGDSGEPPTRRVRTRNEAVEAAGGGERGERLLTALAGGRATGDATGTRARLIVVSRHRQPAGVEDRVELAHEALLTGWKTLAGWIAEHREQLALREQLEHRAGEWQQIQARDPESRCYPGKGDAGLLDAGLLEHYRAVVTPDEVTKRFLAQSRFCVQLEQARADNARLRGLEAEADSLWPSLPATGPAIARWLKDAEEHLARRDQHLEMRETISARRRPTDGEGLGNGARRFEDPEDAWWLRTLGSLVEILDAFTDAEHGLVDGLHPTAGAGVARRLAMARSIERRSVQGDDAARRWDQAIASIADSSVCPAYRGLEVVPQLGLLPLGRNPASGLWEFVSLLSGEQPSFSGRGAVPVEASGIVLVLLPAARCWIGAQKKDRAAPNYDPKAEAGEGRVHPIALDPFFLAKYELTQAQWARIAGSNVAYWNPTSEEAEISLLHPVENVSWQDCQRILGRVALVLPTEAQWEYACRAGKGEAFAHETSMPKEAFANVRDRSWSKIKQSDPTEDFDTGFPVHAPVGTFHPNAFGLCEMHGNVWEWCQDAYGSYDAYPARPGDGLRDCPGDKRVTRGGSFWEPLAKARSAYRDGDPADRKAWHLGVRPARRLES